MFRLTGVNDEALTKPKKHVEIKALLKSCSMRPLDCSGPEDTITTVDASFSRGFYAWSAGLLAELGCTGWDLLGRSLNLPFLPPSCQFQPSQSEYSTLVNFRSLLIVFPCAPPRYPCSPL